MAALALTAPEQEIPAGILCHNEGLAFQDLFDILNEHPLVAYLFAREALEKILGRI